MDGGEEKLEEENSVQKYKDKRITRNAGERKKNTDFNTLHAKLSYTEFTI
jgi:hypothetical protein